MDVTCVTYAALAAAEAAAVIALGPPAGPLNGAKVHLTKAPLPLDDTTTLAALTAIESDYMTYSAKVVTWGTVTTADDGTTEVIGTVPHFEPTDSTKPQSVYHIFLTDGADTTLFLAADVGASPLPMTGPAFQITVVVRYRPDDSSIMVVIS
jgi:hypothetical protein